MAHMSHTKAMANFLEPYLQVQFQLILKHWKWAWAGD